MIRFIHPKRHGGKAARSRSTQIGQLVEGTISDLAADGRGVLRREGEMTLLVAGAWPGEAVRARVTGQRQQVAFAVAEQILKPHHARRIAPCPHHGHSDDTCGGCPWMFIAYPAQVAAKLERVQQALLGIGVPSARCRPVQPAPQPLQYRNRAQLKTDGHALGFLSAGSHSIKDIDRCEVLTPGTQARLTALRSQLPNAAWRPRKGHFTAIDISEKDVSVGRRLPFQQANERQNAYMQHWLARHLKALPEASAILELFAGSGNFTGVLAAGGGHAITACDVVAEATAAIRDLRLANVSITTADLFIEAQVNALGDAHRESRMLVLDPPREGFKLLPLLLDRLPQLNHVIYISCDLATFCRDAGAMLERGFACIEVQPVDQFAQTPHLEILAYFHRERRQGKLPRGRRR